MGGGFNLGHKHPVIVETLGRVCRSISEQRAILAEKLAELTWGDAYTVFGVGGGEAIDEGRASWSYRIGVGPW
jgi:acetylornithine/succinyldiaminopimelate/putrescine aminotransferase